MPPSLTATMYRQVLKAVHQVDDHYQGNANHTLRAILGQSWNPRYWDESAVLQSTRSAEAAAAAPSKTKLKGGPTRVWNRSSLKISTRFFRMCLMQFAMEQKAEKGTKVNSNMTSEMQKVFWLLKQCQTAVPPSEANLGKDGKKGDDSEAEGSFIDRATKVEFLGDETTTFSVRTVIPTMKAHNPLPRHSVPEDPVWMLQTSWSYPSPLCTELLLLEACHARLLAEKSSGVQKAAAGGEQSSVISSETDVVSLLSSQHLTRSIMRENFMKLFAQTTTVTPDGLLEIVCRTEHVGTVRRIKSEAKEEDEDDDDDDDDDTSVKEGSSKSVKEEHAFHYFIAIRNVSDTVPNQEASTAAAGNTPKAKAPPAVTLTKGKTLTLLSRHWTFVDAENGDVREVTGAGVVGQFPTLAPGESHTYVSGTTMAGKYGYMKGTFQFTVHNEEEPSAAPAEGEAAAPPTKKAKGVKKGMKAVVKKGAKKGGSGAAPAEEEVTISNLKLDRTVNAEIGATAMYTTKKATDFEPFGFATDTPKK